MVLELAWHGVAKGMAMEIAWLWTWHRALNIHGHQMARVLKWNDMGFRFAGSALLHKFNKKYTLPITPYTSSDIRRHRRLKLSVPPQHGKVMGPRDAHLS
jgi:hypothetical protein